MAIFFSDSFYTYNESCKAQVSYLKPRDNSVFSNGYLPWNVHFPQAYVLDFFNKRHSMFLIQEEKTNETVTS